MADKENKVPSTAHLDAQGRYVPCKMNQPFAYQDSSAALVPQAEHFTNRQGYCAAHKILGHDCPLDSSD